MKTLLKSTLCVLFAVIIASCAATQTSESTGEYFDNAAITTKVKAKLFHEEQLKSLAIRVKSYKGTVQLSGFVNSPKQIRLAEKIALSTPSVKRVVNNLIVKG